MWGTMMSSQLTLGSILERAGSLFADVQIVSWLPDGTLHRYTYGDFYRRARALGEALQGIGLHRGDRVATLMYNHCAHLESFFGVPAAGGVLHTLNHRLHANDLAYIINHADDKFLIVDQELLPVYEQVKERTGCRKVIVVEHGGGAGSGAYESYEAFLSHAAGNFEPASLHENEGAIMCYTSGVVGSPKGIVYSHRALVLHSLAISLPDAAAINQCDTVLPFVPMYHAHAWGLPLAATLAGCKQVFRGALSDPAATLDFLAGEQVTLSAGVPSVWLGVLHELEKHPGRWKLAPGLRAIISGAAPAPAMIRAMNRLGICVTQAWGLTESGPLATFSTLKPSLEALPDENKYELLASQGRPLPFIELRAMADGEAARDGASLGEAQLRGPWVASAYYNLPELQGKWSEGSEPEIWSPSMPTVT